MKSPLAVTPHSAGRGKLEQKMQHFAMLQVNSAHFLISLEEIVKEMEFSADIVERLKTSVIRIPLRSLINRSITPFHVFLYHNGKETNTFKGVVICFGMKKKPGYFAILFIF